jgi:hypothetical protein
MNWQAIYTWILTSPLLSSALANTLGTVLGGLILLSAGQWLIMRWRVYQVIKKLESDPGAHLGGGDVWNSWWGVVVRNKTEYKVRLYAVKAKMVGESNYRDLRIAASAFDVAVQEDRIICLQPHVGVATCALQGALRIKGVEGIIITYGIETILGGIRQETVKVAQKIIAILNEKAVPAHNDRLVRRLSLNYTVDALRPYLMGNDALPLRLLVRHPQQSHPSEYRVPTDEELRRVIDWLHSPTDFTIDNVDQWQVIAFNLNPVWLVGHAMANNLPPRHLGELPAWCAANQA